MNKLQGRIIHSEKNEGIANIIITAYDLDVPSNAFLKSLPNSSDTLEFWKQVEQKADRLGSTLTDENGNFLLEYADKDFKKSKKEQRPDIVLFVLAPEEQQALHSKTVNTNHPLNRILHYTFTPRYSGGKTESFAIKINPNLESTEAESDGSNVAYIEEIRKKELANKRFKTAFAPIVNERLQQYQSVKQEATFLEAKLTSLSKLEVKSKLFSHEGTDGKTAQKRAMSASLARLNTVASNSVMTPISIDQADITKIIPEFTPDLLEQGEIIKIPHDKYCSLLNKATRGKLYVRKNTLVELLNQLTESETTDEVGNTSVVDGNSDETDSLNTGEEVSEEIDTATFLKQRLQAIYHTDLVKLDNTSLHEKIKTDVRFQEASPIDQNAYHDFHHLQIAFENVWTEIFDKKVMKGIKQSYMQVVNEMGSYNLSSGVREELEALLQAEIVNFREVISIINETANVIGEGIPIPAEVIALSPSKLFENWDKLSIEQQQNIIEIAAKKDAYYKLSRLEQIEVLKHKMFQNRVQIYKEIKQPNWGENDQGEVSQDNWVSLYDWWTQHNAWNDRNKAYMTYLFDNGEFNTTQRTYSSRGKINANHLAEGLLPQPSVPISVELELDRFFTSELVETRELTTQIEKILNNPKGIKSRTEKLIEDLNERLLEPYAFHVFKPNTYNFGIITTYRQEWKPEQWQVGDLVATIPLTPGEKRKFTKKLNLKKTRSQKEVENALYRRTDESSYISKASAEITGKVNNATNFNMNVQGNFGFSIGLFNGGGSTSTTFQNNQSAESARTKKSIREATIKASHEYKNERNIEIASTDEDNYEEHTSGEISNLNNEITVTYLFHELERQFRVSENLHKLTPVVLVAFDVPAPHEIDEAWLLSHEWILRRLLLDDSFNQAFDYLREGLVGDKINFEAAKGHYAYQQKIVDEIAGNVESLSLLKSALQEQLNKSTDNKNIVDWRNRRRSGLLGANIFSAIFNPFALPAAISSTNRELAGSQQYDSEYYEAEREAYETRLNLTREELAAVQNELERELSVLEKAKEQMMAMTDKFYTKRNLINQLRIHIKQNILYYMQGIWEHEPPDQRFFRLYDKIINVPVAGDTIGVRQTSSDGVYGQGFEFFMPPVSDRLEEKRLHIVADLDTLLGFKGNYAIFPLKSCTYITDFMMKDYVNTYLGVQDPDAESEISLEDLQKIYKHIEDNPDYAVLKEQLLNLITARLANPSKQDELIVVPTGQLFIEALPGKHALLEDFKQKHRAMDVLKVQEEVKEAELENLRRSLRMIEGELDDPDVEKRVIIENGVDDVNLGISS